MGGEYGIWGKGLWAASWGALQRGNILQVSGVYGVNRSAEHYLLGHAPSRPCRLVGRAGCGEELWGMGLGDRCLGREVLDVGMRRGVRGRQVTELLGKRSGQENGCVVGNLGGGVGKEYFFGFLLW